MDGTMHNFLAYNIKYFHTFIACWSFHCLKLSVQVIIVTLITDLRQQTVFT